MKFYWRIFLFLLLSEPVCAQLFNQTNQFTHEYGLTVMTSAPAQNTLMAGDEKGNLYFHELTSGTFLRQLKMNEKAIAGLRFNSTGKLLISYTYDGEIKIFDFDKDRIVQSVYSPDYSGIQFVVFSIADGFIYFNGHNRLYKTRSDLTQQVDLILTEEDSLTDAVITNDRSALIYASGNKLKVINTRTDQVIQDVSAGFAQVVKLALVGDTLLTSWSSDGTIAYWRYAVGQLQTIPILTFKAGNPSPMSFTSDGKLMASGMIGSWARLWQPLDRYVFQELFAHKNTVTCVTFGSTDDVLYTGSLDGKIIRWKKGAPVPKNPEPKDTVIPPVVIQPKKDTLPQKTESVPEVHMTQQNVPTTIRSRSVNNSRDLEVHSTQLKIFVYDNSSIDGDTISLFFNGQWILNGYGVTKKKKELALNLLPNTNNFLVLFANNLGKSPPNTAAVEIVDGNSVRIFRLSSDLKSCSAINFIYKP